MVDERANRASAGVAQRQRRPRGGPVAAAAREAAKPDLDARERRISPNRKAMGPTVPPDDARRAGAARAPAGPSDEPPTDLD